MQAKIVRQYSVQTEVQDFTALKPILLQIFCVHIVLRILVCQETGDVDDGRVEAAADVPPRGGRRRLSDEHLGAAEVVHVYQRHTAGVPLDGFQHRERCLVT